MHCHTDVRTYQEYYGHEPEHCHSDGSSDDAPSPRRQTVVSIARQRERLGPCTEGSIAALSLLTAHPYLDLVAYPFLQSLSPKRTIPSCSIALRSNSSRATVAVQGAAAIAPGGDIATHAGT